MPIRSRCQIRSGARAFRLLLAFPCLFGVACTTPPPQSADRELRVARAEQGLEGDPVLQARRAGVEAAEARAQRARLVDDVELRVEEDYRDEHQIRTTARLRMDRPAELRAQREISSAEAEIELSRLEETSLERRAELCFPAVEASAQHARGDIYASYASRQQGLLDWSEELRGSGVIDELSAARFELASRVKLATREPLPIPADTVRALELPEIGRVEGSLVRDPEYLRETVRRHHPSVAVRRATAERYRSLAERARARSRPWLRFVDVSYERRVGGKARNGVGGQLAFDVPFGGQQRADMRRFEALMRQEHAEAEALVEEQVLRTLQALIEVDQLEARADQWRDLEEQARAAEEVADRWWQSRLAGPSDVSALLDDAFAARTAVLEAQERVASAHCTLLAMTGVPLDEWPRR